MNFQSPFRRGNGCYGLNSDGKLSYPNLSVPFSSGQWLLPTTSTMASCTKGFQSPFRRGNGCYGLNSDGKLSYPNLSVPFSSGQWLLLNKLHSQFLNAITFSPLFVGAMVATPTPAPIAAPFGPFSPLFVGAMVATSRNLSVSNFSPAFSPLFVGAMVATPSTKRSIVLC